jgi:hypothetical protein
LLTCAPSFDCKINSGVCSCVCHGVCY